MTSKDSSNSKRSSPSTPKAKDRSLYLKVAKNHRRCLGVTVSAPTPTPHSTTTTRHKTHMRRCLAVTKLKLEVLFASRRSSARRSRRKRIIAWRSSTPSSSACSHSSRSDGPKSTKNRSSIANSCVRLRIRTGMWSWRCRRSWELRPAAQNSASTKVVMCRGASPITSVNNRGAGLVLAPKLIDALRRPIDPLESE